MTATHSDDERDDTSPPQRRNALEWAVFGLGVCLTLGVLGTLTYEATSGTDAPPRLEVALLPARTEGATLMVPLSVRNRGERVAEEAVVEVCAGPGACAEVTFRYVPKGSTREGTVGLPAPLVAPLTSRVVSFRTP